MASYGIVINFILKTPTFLEMNEKSWKVKYQNKK